MADIGYIRVSTIEQNTERQLDGVKLDKTFDDKASGSSTDRPQLIAMLDYARSGDTIHVHSIDRLARNLRDLQNLLHDLSNKGVHIQFHKEGLTFLADEEAAPMQKLMLQIMGAVADFERTIIRERQAEGIAKAKERGVYDNRSRKVQINSVHKMSADGMGATEIASVTGISRAHVYRLLKEAA
jgi:DNA invertase Pin-like site-specific DNA recombinase